MTISPPNDETQAAVAALSLSHPGAFHRAGSRRAGTGGAGTFGARCDPSLVARHVPDAIFLAVIVVFLLSGIWAAVSPSAIWCSITARSSGTRSSRSCSYLFRRQQVGCDRDVFLCFRLFDILKRAVASSTRR
jgi:hypothetical protein